MATLPPLSRFAPPVAEAPRLPPPDEARREVLGLSFFPQQWLAVTAPLGPVLVLAGPGAGKTRCLTGRIGHLVAKLRADPARVCAITFTNKAAQEIAGRLRMTLGDLSDRMTLGTIHKLCLDVLRADGNALGRRVGLTSRFGVASDEQQRLVLGRLGVHTRRHGQLLLLFGKRRLQNYELTEQDEGYYQEYCRVLRSNGLIDFDEILQLTHLLLRDTPTVRAQWQARWDHVLVDEFQDLDTTQYEIVRLLADGHRSLFAVGDDEQSIFSWRGADSKVMARFAADFGIDCPVILDVNCRCSRAIFEAARRVLPPPEPLFTKDISAVRDSAFPVRAVEFADESTELAWVVEDLQRELATSPLPRGEYAILYRTHVFGQRLEEALIAAGIPCQLARGQSLSDDPLVGRILAALRVVLHPDADLEIEQLAVRALSENVLAEVRRSPGPTVLAKLRAFADANKPDSRKAWKFLYQVENLRGMAKVHTSVRQLIDTIQAQGVGDCDGPLETCHEELTDPAALPWARELGERLIAATEAGGRVLLAPAAGLAVVARIMLHRVLPGLHVQYLQLSDRPSPRDVLLDLDGSRALVEEGRLRVVQLFKALQYVESRPFRRTYEDYVVFDTETTGLDVNACEVIELAAVRVRGGEVVDHFHSLVRTSQPIPPESSAVHGYTDGDLRDAPPIDEVWARFREFVGDRGLVVHNGHRFDVPVLRRVTDGLGGWAGLSFFDTLALARALIPVGSLKLASLAERFSVSTGRSHHALDDCECLQGVFEALQRLRLVRSRKTCLADLLDCLALGSAIEGVPPDHREDRALVEAARWRDLRRRSPVVDAYVDEAERLGPRCPPLSELLRRLAEPPSWPGAGQQPPPGHDRYPESYDRLRRLLAACEGRDLETAVRDLLDRVALTVSTGAETDPDRVSLLTFHATKGLEFSRTYLIGIEDNQLPGRRALDEKKEAEIAESRRLLYVAMTRAKDRLTLTCCRERNGMESGGTLFLDEMAVTKQPPA